MLLQLLESVGVDDLETCILRLGQTRRRYDKRCVVCERLGSVRHCFFCGICLLAGRDRSKSLSSISETSTKERFI
jgi:hypothetical protein